MDGILGSDHSKSPISKSGIVPDHLSYLHRFGSHLQWLHHLLHLQTTQQGIGIKTMKRGFVNFGMKDFLDPYFIAYTKEPSDRKFKLK